MHGDFDEDEDPDFEPDEPREERQKLDDDGAEYSDPRDEQEKRRKALDARFDQLVDFVTGPRPE